MSERFLLPDLFLKQAGQRPRQQRQAAGSLQPLAGIIPDSDHLPEARAAITRNASGITVQYRAATLG